MKKILVVLLSIMMVFCMLPVMGYAADETTVDINAVYSAAITSTTISGQKVLANNVLLVTKDGYTKTDILGAITAYYTNPGEAKAALSSGNLDIANPDQDKQVVFKLGTQIVTGDKVTAPGSYTVTIPLKSTSGAGGFIVDETKTVTVAFSIMEPNLNASYATIQAQGGGDVVITPQIFDYLKITDTVTDAKLDEVNGTDSSDNKAKQIFQVVYNGQVVDENTFRYRVTTNGTTSLTVTIEYTDKTFQKMSAYSGTNKQTQTFIKTTAFEESKMHIGVRTYSGSVYTVAELGIDRQTYDGTEKKPAFSLFYDTTPLTLNTDYTVTYSNNINVGSGVATITGKGAYSGEVVRFFSIDAKPISTVNVIVTSTALNSEPDLVVTDGTKTLTKNTDYTVAVTGNNKASGTAVVTLTGMGNYTGTKAVTYTVGSDATGYNLSSSNTDITMYGITGTYTYTGYAIKPTVSIIPVTTTVGTYTYSKYFYENVDYKIVYTDNIEVGTNTAKAYVVGMGQCYGTREFTFSITPAYATALTITGLQDSYAYTGYQITPSVLVYLGNKLLTKDKDYTVQYGANLNQNTNGTILVTGNGTNIIGTTTKSFTIGGKSISGCTATFEDGKSYSEYDGKYVTKKVTVKDGTKTLTEGTDYTITYVNAAGTSTTVGMKETGTYAVTLTGKGTYSGTKTLSYIITGLSISNYTLTITPEKAKYDGYAKTIVTTVKNGTTTLASTNYDVTIYNSAFQTVTAPKEAGTYYIYVTGKGQYSGTLYAIYTVEEDKKVDPAKTLSALTVKVRTENVSNGIKIYVMDGTKDIDLSELTKEGYTVYYNFYKSTYNGNYKLALTKTQSWYINTGARVGSKYYYKVAITVKDKTGSAVASTNIKNCYYGARTRKAVK